MLVWRRQVPVALSLWHFYSPLRFSHFDLSTVCSVKESNGSKTQHAPGLSWDKLARESSREEQQLHLGSPEFAACNAGDAGSIFGLERSPGGGMGAHFSILAWEIPWRRGAWWTRVHGVARVGHSWSDLARTRMHRGVHADTCSHSCLSSGGPAPPGLWLNCESNQSLLWGFLIIVDMGSVFRKILTKNEGELTKMRLLAPLTTTTTQNNNIAEIEECRTPVHYS